MRLSSFPASLRAAASVLLFAAMGAFAQPSPEFVRVSPSGPLDPVRDLSPMPTVGTFHTPLPEQYIWTVGDAAVYNHLPQLSRLKSNDWKVEPHYFRRAFNLASVPPAATLYLAGPRKARVWINGTLAADLAYAPPKPHIGFMTMTADVARFLRPGPNTVAVEAVRGYGSHHHTNSTETCWLNSGEVLAFKILPAAPGIDATSLLISDGSWKSSLEATNGWQQTAFDDASWKSVFHLGIESSADFFQWSADDGMYAWPGYLGEAPYMANYRLAPASTTQTPGGLLLDFGRELNGRLVLRAGAQPLSATVRYGESTYELLHAPFLGELAFQVPANTELRGPKSGFRYALVSFAGPSDGTQIEAEGIVYPVKQIGSFSSNDPLLNRIWESSVYTAHLCMQDAILDGIKRDRGLWIGDSEVINRTVAGVYGDARLVKSSLENSIGPAPVRDHVNGLIGYSAWWVVAEAEYVQRWGDLDQLTALKQRLLDLLQVMERELNAQSLFDAPHGGELFVDWAPTLNHDTPETRHAIHFQYVLAFRRAAALLRLAGDPRSADHYAALADAMTKAAENNLRAADGSYGQSWQTNALAVLAGAVRSDAQRQAVWRVLARTVAPHTDADRITPYYGSYLLTAMAALGHRAEALQWIKSYWGGMLDQGATSFWEAWDPSWAGADPHTRLEADQKKGTYTSLAHGWSSSPAPWLQEELLGITASEPGYRSAVLRPDLAGLASIEGAVATPHGPIRLQASSTAVTVEIPAGIHAELLLPTGDWLQENEPIAATAAESGSRMRLLLHRPGRYIFEKK